MGFLIRSCNALRTAQIRYQASTLEILYHVPSTLWSVSIDSFPGRCGGVREFIWASTDHGTVSLVESVYAEGEVAIYAGVKPGKTSCGPEFGSGVDAKGVEVDVVEDVSSNTQKELRKLVCRVQFKIRGYRLTVTVTATKD